MKSDVRPEELESSIARTRAEMDETLRALEARLTPGQLIDQGIDYLRHSGANEFIGNLGASVKQNPMPVTLVGIGLAWMMAANGHGPVAYQARRDLDWESEQASSDSVADRLHEGTARMREGASGMMNKAAGAVDSAREGLRAAGESVSDTAAEVKQRASELTQQARERARRLREEAGHQIDRARSGYDTMVREQPLALGAIGLAIGALAAAMLPRTRQEDRLMGGARDRLVERASSVASDRVEQAMASRDIGAEVSGAVSGMVGGSTQRSVERRNAERRNLEGKDGERRDFERRMAERRNNAAWQAQAPRFGGYDADSAGGDDFRVTDDELGLSDSGLPESGMGEPGVPSTPRVLSAAETPAERSTRRS